MHSKRMEKDCILKQKNNSFKKQHIYLHICLFLAQIPNLDAIFKKHPLEKQTTFCQHIGRIPANFMHL